MTRRQDAIDWPFLQSRRNSMTIVAYLVTRSHRKDCLACRLKRGATNFGVEGASSVGLLVCVRRLFHQTRCDPRDHWKVETPRAAVRRRSGART